MTRNKKQLIVEVDERFHRDIKIAASKHGLSMKDYILGVLAKQLIKESK